MKIIVIVIESNWVFKKKLKSNGELERCKGSLVDKGFAQKQGINFDETFALVAKQNCEICC